jgi:hypothetical protein
LGKGEGLEKAGEGIIREVVEPLAKKAAHVGEEVAEDTAATAAKDAAKRESRQALIDELRRDGVKFDENAIVRIGRDGSGKVIFLETGNARAGLEHILVRHEDDFARRGIPKDKIADFVFDAATSGTKVGQQSATRAGRDVFETTWEGGTQRVAISIGDNGFIVGSNPA